MTREKTELFATLTEDEILSLTKREIWILLKIKALENIFDEVFISNESLLEEMKESFAKHNQNSEKLNLKIIRNAISSLKSKGFVDVLYDKKKRVLSTKKRHAHNDSCHAHNDGNVTLTMTPRHAHNDAPSRSELRPVTLTMTPRHAHNDNIYNNNNNKITITKELKQNNYIPPLPPAGGELEIEGVVFEEKKENVFERTLKNWSDNSKEVFQTWIDYSIKKNPKIQLISFEMLAKTFAEKEKEFVKLAQHAIANNLRRLQIQKEAPTLKTVYEQQRERQDEAMRNFAALAENLKF